MQLFMELYYHPWALFIWGACWGSFFNVVLYRYPLGLSVVQPGSACPGCNKEIRFYDNIPIFSWLVLRGKCRNCKQPISPRYILNEALFGLMAAWPVWLHQTDWIKGISLSTTSLTIGPLVYLFIRHRRAPWYLATGFVLATGFYLVQFASR